MCSVLLETCSIILIEISNDINADKEENVLYLTAEDHSKEIHSFMFVCNVRVKGKRLARLFNSAC